MGKEKANSKLFLGRRAAQIKGRGNPQGDSLVGEEEGGGNSRYVLSFVISRRWPRGKGKEEVSYWVHLTEEERGLSEHTETGIDPQAEREDRK